MSGDKGLDLKPASQLLGVDRLARRIQRTVSKVIRLDICAGLALSSAAHSQLMDIVDGYLAVVATAGRAPETKAWLSAREIESPIQAANWLHVATISETAKRLAGLNGVASDDFVSFRDFVLPAGRRNCIAELPLLEDVRQRLGAVFDRRDMPAAQGIVAICHRDFVEYQRSGAEKCIAAFSLRPPGLRGEQRTRISLGDG
jgi:hypothetical protein